MLGQIADNDKTLVEIWQTENTWGMETTDSYPTEELVSHCGLGLSPSGASAEPVRVIKKTRRYAIAPTVLLQAQREARDRQLDVIGFYHSHPDHQAIPSEFDRVYAWQQYSYIIVSVQKGKACELLCWSLNEQHQFQPEEIVKNY